MVLAAPFATPDPIELLPDPLTVGGSGTRPLAAAAQRADV